MSKILLFPHGRASVSGSGSGTGRAANVVMISAVRPACRAVAVHNNLVHHSAGMLSRCHHLLMADAPAPGTSVARASREGHSSMIERNEPKSDMATLLGPLVLKSKAKTSQDCGPRGHVKWLMRQKQPVSQFELEFIDRTRRARAAAGLTQDQIARELGLEQDTYKNYERVRPLPHEYVLSFCTLVSVTLGWLYAGKVESLEPSPKRRRRGRRPNWEKVA